MANQIQISIDEELYIILKDLCVPPDDVNAVLRRLMFNAGKIKSSALLETEGESKHRTFEEELEAARAGVYANSGICS